MISGRNRACCYDYDTVTAGKKANENGVFIHDDAKVSKVNYSFHGTLVYYVISL